MALSRRGLKEITKYVSEEELGQCQYCDTYRKDLWAQQKHVNGAHDMVVIRSATDPAVHDKPWRIDFVVPTAEQQASFDQHRVEERLRKKKQRKEKWQPEAAESPKQPHPTGRIARPPRTESTPAGSTPRMPQLVPAMTMERLQSMTPQQMDQFRFLTSLAMREYAIEIREAKLQGVTKVPTSASSASAPSSSQQMETEEVLRHVSEALHSINDNGTDDDDVQITEAAKEVVNTRMVQSIGNPGRGAHETVYRRPMSDLFSARILCNIVLARKPLIEFEATMMDLATRFPECTRHALAIRCSIAIETMKDVVRVLIKPPEVDADEKVPNGKGKTKAESRPGSEGRMLVDGRFVHDVLASNGLYLESGHSTPEINKLYDSGEIFPARVKLATRSFLLSYGRVLRSDATECFRLTNITKDWEETVEFAEIGYLAMADTAYKMLAASAPLSVNMSPPCVMINLTKLHQLIPETSTT